VYEKGKQLGDLDSPWVRYEGEFKASTRKELPLDMLRDPAAYLIGAYPVLRFIDAVASRIPATKEAAIATWKSARRHLKRQYGATLNFVARHTPDDLALARVVRSLTTNKLPSWSSGRSSEIVARNSGRTTPPRRRGNPMYMSNHLPRLDLAQLAIAIVTILSGTADERGGTFTDDAGKERAYNVRSQKAKLEVAGFAYPYKVRLEEGQQPYPAGEYAA
jgi:hypothetical protein